jgi:serine/threonine protein kinase
MLLPARYTWRVPATVGGYQLVRRIAVGGMAEVFLARKPGPEGFEKRVALKRILPHLAAQTDFVAMFLDEARLAARLDHPHIVHIHDFGVDDDGNYYLAMEYVNGEDLSGLITRARERGRPLPLADAGTILLNACEALHHAHEQGVVHRDVTPANLLVSYDGVVKLADFGIAKSQSAASRTQTNAGTLKGKIPYMSPEQARAKPLDRRSDVFSLGVCAWELITGERLFHRKHELDMLRAVQMCDVPALSTVRGDVPAALEAAVARALAPEPERRWSTAAELAAAIHGWMGAAGVTPSKARLARTMAQLFGDDAARRRLGTLDREMMDPTAPNLAAGAAARDEDDLTPPQKEPKPKQPRNPKDGKGASGAGGASDAKDAGVAAPGTPRRSPLDSARSWPALPDGDVEADAALAPTQPRWAMVADGEASAGAPAKRAGLHPERWIPQIAMHLHLPPARMPPLRLLVPLLGLVISAGGLLFGLHSPHTRRALTAPSLVQPGMSAPALAASAPVMVPRALKLATTPLRLGTTGQPLIPLPATTTTTTPSLILPAATAAASTAPSTAASAPESSVTASPAGSAPRLTRPTPAVGKMPAKRHVRRPRRARGGKV